MKQSGNALFLILIAVALFAALSYAVTQSGRGGGSIDREQAEILAAQILQEISIIENEIRRNQVFRDYDQIQFTINAENASGTVYDPDGGTSTGRTIGLFGSGLGLNFPTFFDGAYSSLAPPTWALLYNGGLEANQNGAEPIGTTAGDVIIGTYPLTDAVCTALNRGFHDDASAPTISVTGAATTDGHTIVGTTVTLTASGATIRPAAVGPSVEYPLCDYSVGALYYPIIVR